jgi:hypothetical protein
MEKIPYVHLYTDALEALPFLARGSNAVVFAAVGLLLPTYPDGADAETVANFCALTKRTVDATLGLLLHSGLIAETSDGNFIPVKYIEYRKPDARVARTGIDSSIFQSSKSNQSVNQSSGEEFSKSYTALCNWLLLRGGIRSDESEAFKMLYAENPDPELHKRALEISQRKAETPNYKYYARVVESGAVDYDAKSKTKEPEPIEVLL